MRTGHPALHPQALRLVSQCFDMARVGIIGFVAMHINHKTTVCRYVAKVFNRRGTVSHRAFKMRDTTNHIDTFVEGADRIFQRVRAAIQPILRKCDQLQIDIASDQFADFQQRLDAKQAIVASVDMGPDGKQAHAGGPVAILQGAVANLLKRHDLL